MKILKSKKSLTILGGSAAVFVMVAGLSIGLGVGLTRDNSISASTDTRPDLIPLEPSTYNLIPINDAKQISLDFSIQDVNSSLNNVLAVNLTGISQNNFANFQYLASSDPTSLELHTSSDSANFNFATGESNSLYNGFGSQGTQRFYVPITEGENASYLILQKGSSDNTTTNYLYVEGIGTFTDGTNVFDQSFSGIGLTSMSSSSLNLTFEIGTPVSVPVPTREILNFITQDINSQLSGVLAINTTNLDTTNFAKLVYVVNSDPNPVPLTKNGGSATFNVTTGNENSDNVLLNGFSQNGHLYLPITTSDGSNATYLELEDATSDDNNRTYLYVDGLGSFGTDNIFNETFKATNLNQSPTLNLILSTNGTPNPVPQPTVPETTTVDMTVFNSPFIFGRTLASNIASNSDFDLSNLLYLSSDSDTNIVFSSSTSGGLTFNCTLLTGASNEGFILSNSLYMPISPIVRSSISYDNIVFNVSSLDSSSDIYFFTYTLYSSSNETTVSFQNLTNNPSATLDFALGN